MAQQMEEKLESLKQAIEELRSELHETALQEGSSCCSEKTYAVSSQLDRLIVQFLKVKEKMPGSGPDEDTGDEAQHLSS